MHCFWFMSTRAPDPSEQYTCASSGRAIRLHQFPHNITALYYACANLRSTMRIRRSGFRAAHALFMAQEYACVSLGACMSLAFRYSKSIRTQFFTLAMRWQQRPRKKSSMGLASSRIDVVMLFFFPPCVWDDEQSCYQLDRCMQWSQGWFWMINRAMQNSWATLCYWVICHQFFHLQLLAASAWRCSDHGHHGWGLCSSLSSSIFSGCC